MPCTSHAPKPLAVASITLTTGVSMSGRAFALNGAVTMDTDNVSIRGAAPDVTPPPPAGQAPVTLSLTGRFAILSYAGITNTGPTSITGDIGARPITGASMTGFETVALVGTIYTVDAAGPTGYVTNPTMLTQAMVDLTTAYNDAAGRTSTDIVTLSGNIGGWAEIRWNDNLENM